MKAFKISLFAVFVLIGWLMINCLLSFRHYNLYETGKWESAKTKLEKGVWGGYSMIFSNAALAGGKLNLNAWHGHQEITIRDAVAANTIKFIFSPGGQPFSFIINKTDSGSTGVTFYPNGESRLRFYTSGSMLQFLNSQSLALHVAAKPGSNTAEVKCIADTVFVYLNNELAGAWAHKVPGAVKFGFKGDEEYKNIYIDNIMAENDRHQPVFAESFSFPLHIYAISMLYLVVCFGMMGWLLYREKFSAYSVYVVFLGGAAISIVVGYYYYAGCARYNTEVDDIDWHGIKSTIETEEMVDKRIAADYPVEKIAAKKRVVIMMGASQTWGAGASTANATYSALLQDSLQRILDDTNIIVINTAVSALEPESMYDHYMNKWVQYKPELLILNASNNSIDTNLLAQKLQAMVLYNRKNGIKTLFIEGPSEGANHVCEKDLVLRTVAGKNDLASVELNHYMQLYADSGFCWWDAVHLTDYGHYLVAKRVLPFALAAMNNPARSDSIAVEKRATEK